MQHTTFTTRQEMAVAILNATPDGEVASVGIRTKLDREAVALLTNTFGWQVVTFTPNEVQIRKPV